MGGYVEGAARTQSVLFPERLDVLLDQDDYAQAIDAFVDEMDLSGCVSSGPNLPRWALTQLDPGDTDSAARQSWQANPSTRPFR
jgi:hypothetical protein